MSMAMTPRLNQGQLIAEMRVIRVAANHTQSPPKEAAIESDATATTSSRIRSIVTAPFFDSIIHAQPMPVHVMYRAPTANHVGAHTAEKLMTKLGGSKCMTR